MDGKRVHLYMLAVLGVNGSVDYQWQVHLRCGLTPRSEMRRLVGIWFSRSFSLVWLASLCPRCPLRLQPSLLCPFTHWRRGRNIGLLGEKTGTWRIPHCLGWSIYLEVDLLSKEIKSQDKPWALGTKEKKHAEFSSRSSGCISQYKPKDKCFLDEMSQRQGSGSRGHAVGREWVWII